MSEDRIEREIVVSAPGSVCGRSSRKRNTWANGSANQRRSICGLAARSVLRWQKHGTVYGTIEKIDEPHYFSYRWVPGILDEKPRHENSTLVEFTLTPQGGQTRLREVETGFSHLPRNESERAEQFEDNTKGWASEQRELQQYVGQLPV